jgi:hypothetical protein
MAFLSPSRLTSNDPFLLSIAWAHVSADATSSMEPFHRWMTPEGDVWTEFFRIGTDYLLRFPGKADFHVSADGLHIEERPVAGCSRETLAHLYQNQVVPLALSRQGYLVLHASAVMLEGRAIAFLGRTGQGKSTLAASLARSGGALLTDDGLQIEMRESQPFAVPSHPSLRLWEDSRQALGGPELALAPPLDYTSKSRITGGGGLAFADAPAPLALSVVLGEAAQSEPSTLPLKPAEAMMAMVANSFVLDVSESAMLARHFEHIAALAALPMHYRLDYPRSYDKLPSVRKAIRAQFDRTP